MQARLISSCGVCVSVCVPVTFVNSVKTNKHIFKNFSQLGSQAILVFPYQTAWQYSDGRGASNAGGVGRNRDSEPICGFIACCERCDRQVLSTRLLADTWLSIDDYWRLELVLSNNGGPSSGVSQLWCKSVYGTESHAPVNTLKRREHNLIYAG